MRVDARIALRALRSLLGGGSPSEVDVAGTSVSFDLSGQPSKPWPSELEDVSEAEDGPWPPGLKVLCKWVGGACTLFVEIFVWQEGKYRHDLCLRVRTENREVVFVNVQNEIEKTKDGDTATPAVRFFVTKRKSHKHEEVTDLLNDAMRETLQESEIPFLGKNTAELCEIEVPAGTLQPAPEHAFLRLVRLALLKLDFIDAKQTAERGKPLVDLGAWLSEEQMGWIGDVETDSDQEQDSERGTERRYWAGGFDKQASLQSFKAENVWRMSFKRTSDKPNAKAAWKQFSQIRVGDWFAIKGLGGQNDLVVHKVGEVTSIDAETGSLKLKPLAVPLYKGKGPTGKGAGNWHTTLVAVELPPIIKMIFGVAGSATKSPQIDQVWKCDLPKNLILYGPPGTGKTHHITSQLMDLFQRQPAKADAEHNIVAELSWAYVAALALHDLGKPSKVAALMSHPLVRAKYASSASVQNLRSRLWSTLQSHTVETSKTVKYANRSSEQFFDKTTDSNWFLTELPESLAELAKQQKANPEATIDDFTFVTFHQAYNYEDFIEGIRPRLDEDAGSLSYELRDGLLLEAARAALRLAGFDGTMHDFCNLTPAEREAQFQGKRGYAVFIDEINRGNVARIFGELITLIEDDKRLGTENEVIVQLPYSKQKFGVPPNLYIIGTMNTADRSIEALDTALRRRFDFRELPPDLQLLDFEVDGIRPDTMLREINRRLEKLYDRDHCIGHAYFYSLRKKGTFDDLKRVFKNKIIPLLQEYFYGDWGKIGLVLGKDFVRKRDAGKAFASFEHDDQDALASRSTWELADIDKLTNTAFKRIYSDVTEP